MLRYVALLCLLVVLAGCPVTQRQDTPVAAVERIEAGTGRHYWLYVPSYYDDRRDWPLVITLHGTHGWDNARAQIKEWKFLAEQRGLIIAAPVLRSVQGILPVVGSLWRKDLQADERAVLAVIDEVSAKYRVDPKAVLLTGFSAGGYPLYYVGLRNPGRFDMLIARACNSSTKLLEHIEPTDEARRLPIVIFWGKDDLREIQAQSWQAFRFLREHRFFETRRKEIRGGHLRRPERAYAFWRERLPARHRME